MDGGSPSRPRGQVTKLSFTMANCYLLGGDGGFVMVDCGPPARGPSIRVTESRSSSPRSSRSVDVAGSGMPSTRSL
jgi:hypothetical protein